MSTNNSKTTNKKNNNCAECHDSGWAPDDNATLPLWQRKPCTECAAGRAAARRVEMAAGDEGERRQERRKYGGFGYGDPYGW